MNESAKLPFEKRLEMIDGLEDNHFQKEAGEKLIAIIDNLETSSKAILMGKLIYLIFGQKLINKEDFGESHL